MNQSTDKPVTNIYGSLSAMIVASIYLQDRITVALAGFEGFPLCQRQDPA